MPKPLLCAAFAMSLLAFAAEAAAQDANPELTPELTGALDEAALASESVGSAAFGLSLQNLTATNSGNSVTAETVETGDIVFDGSALSGFNGIGNFVMNTGNNNNLQGSISVVVVMTPP